MNNHVSKLYLQDCDVGKIYKKKVTLTNVTYMTNYCKLLGVSQNLKDYVSVRWVALLAHHINILHLGILSVSF